MYKLHHLRSMHQGRAVRSFTFISECISSEFGPNPGTNKTTKLWCWIEKQSTPPPTPALSSVFNTLTSLLVLVIWLCVFFYWGWNHAMFFSQYVSVPFDRRIKLLGPSDLLIFRENRWYRLLSNRWFPSVRIIPEGKVLTCHLSFGIPHIFSTH